MKYKYKPKNKEELVEAIKKEIYEIQGTKDTPNWQADLNCIDTSLITDMSGIFSKKYRLKKFNGNISNWNVSNVIDMKSLFANSNFNGNISNWDVSNVITMNFMFYYSKFNEDISNWNVSNVKNMAWMFEGTIFNQDISKWDTSNVTNMESMFQNSKFNKPINNWNISNVENIEYMFFCSEFNQDISNWNLKNMKNASHVFSISKFNKDIGNWPKKIKEQTELKNISVSPKYPRLPDEIKYPETVANIFNYVINNPNSKEITKSQAVNILTEWMNNKQKEYLNRSLDRKTLKQLLTNYFLDILKDINNKNKFLEILKNLKGYN